MTTELRFRGDGDEPSFSKWLANLKQVGSNLLITGEVPDTVSARATRYLFGRADRRFRVLALTDQTAGNAATRLPDDASAEDPTTWVVDERRAERSAPATASGATAELDPVGSDGARRLCNEIEAAVDFYDEYADGLEPAELRLGVDSLFPLLQDDSASAEHVLRRIGSTVRDVYGMAHYHLRVPADAAVVEDLMPLFDARVELRKRPRRTPEQRWYAPELDATTPWMEL
jgi:hypothetical protein